MSELEAWHDFYVIVGSAAAGLTGLMFVVVSLSSGTMIARTAAGVRAFVTPTVAYFSTVLVVAAVMTVPTLSDAVLAGALALGSVGALIYMVTIRGHTQWREGNLDRLDWCWYVGLPAATYALTLAAAVGIAAHVPFALETVGAAMILLLVIGIRNAWDMVIWMRGRRPSAETPAADA